jgi:hypothetical protein
MKALLFFAAIFFTAVFCAPDINAQTIIREAQPNESFAGSGSSTLKKAAPGSVKKSAESSAQNQQLPYTRPDAKKRFIGYVNGMFGPVALGKDVLTAGYSTWRNSPEEWGDRWEGFGRRMASNVGKGIIKETVIYGLGETFKLDSKYYRSRKKDVGSRVANALVSTATARDKDGKRVFGFPRIAGTYIASIVAAETWYPARFGWKDGLKNGTVTLGFTAAFNLVKEFIWKK